MTLWRPVLTPWYQPPPRPASAPQPSSRRCQGASRQCWQTSCTRMVRICSAGSAHLPPAVITYRSCLRLVTSCRRGHPPRGRGSPSGPDGTRCRCRPHAGTAEYFDFDLMNVRGNAKCTRRRTSIFDLCKQRSAVSNGLRSSLDETRVHVHATVHAHSAQTTVSMLWTT